MADSLCPRLDRQSVEANSATKYLGLAPRCTLGAWHTLAWNGDGHQIPCRIRIFHNPAQNTVETPSILLDYLQLVLLERGGAEWVVDGGGGGGGGRRRRKGGYARCETLGATRSRSRSRERERGERCLTPLILFLLSDFRNFQKLIVGFHAGFATLGASVGAVLGQLPP